MGENDQWGRSLKRLKNVPIVFCTGNLIKIVI